MDPSPTVFEGVVHGKTIELAQAPSLPDGQPVSVILQAIPTCAVPLPPGEGLRRAFGAWAEDGEALDQFLEETRRSRKRSRPEIDP